MKTRLTFRLYRHTHLTLIWMQLNKHVFCRVSTMIMSCLPVTNSDVVTGKELIQPVYPRKTQVPQRGISSIILYIFPSLTDTTTVQMLYSTLYTSFTPETLPFFKSCRPCGTPANPFRTSTGCVFILPLLSQSSVCCQNLAPNS